MLKCLATLTLWIVFATLPAFAAEVESLPPIDAKADEVLLEMSAFLASLPQFTFHTESSSDKVLDSGQTIQLSEGVDIAIRRPNRFWVSAEGDIDTQQLFYDGENVTLFHPIENVYASIKAPDTIDAALDYAKEAFSLKAPLAGLLVSDVYGRVTPNIDTGLYLGLHRVNGVSSHHLAFTSSKVDWQIWVDAGDKPWPRKVIITAKRVAGAPQFTALLSDWVARGKFKDSKFKFVAPKGAHKIEFLPAGN